MTNIIEQRLAALCDINSRYKNFIEGNSILKHDFAALMECSEQSDIMKLQHYREVISHLIAEVDEAESDSIRISDESPICVPETSDACNHRQQRHDLRRELVVYQTTYLAE